MSEEVVMVRPARTYLEGSELKTPESEPYPVGRARALDLRGNGLVTWDGPEIEPEPERPAQTSKPAPAAPKANRRRTRAT